MQPQSEYDSPQRFCLQSMLIYANITLLQIISLAGQFDLYSNKAMHS